MSGKPSPLMSMKRMPRSRYVLAVDVLAKSVDVAKVHCELEAVFHPVPLFKSTYVLLPLEYTQSSRPSPLTSTSWDAVSVWIVVGKLLAAVKTVVVASHALPLPRYVVVANVPGSAVT